MITGKTGLHTIFSYFWLLLFLGCLGYCIYTGQNLWALVPFAALFMYASWQKWEWLWFLLIISIPWSIEYRFPGNLGTDLPDEPLMIGITMMVVAIWLLKPGMMRKAVPAHPLVWIYFISLLWLSVTVFFSEYFAVSLKLWITKTWYTGAFLLAPLLYFRGKAPIRKTAIWLLVSVLLCVLVVVIRHASLGFSFITINKAVVPFFRNHVNYSSLLVCMVPVLCAIISLGRRNRFFYWLILSFVLFALFLTYARGAWLALLTGAIAVILVRLRLLFTVYIVALVIFIGTFLWLRSGDRYMAFAHDYQSTIFHSDFREHLVATYEWKDISTAERFNRWVAALHMSGEKPLTGFGPATYYFRYKPYMSPAFRTWVSNNPEHSTVHNYFLLVLVEQGIPGFLLFAILTGAMLYYAGKLYHRIGDRFYRVVVLATSSMLVMILTLNFLSDLVETDKIGSLFLLCMAMLISIDANTKENITTAREH